MHCSTGRQMSDFVSRSKNLEAQMPVPADWVPELSRIVEAIRHNCLEGYRSELVRPVGIELASSIQSNIRRYGAKLGSLPPETWHTSACQWMGGYWDVLVDLYTEEKELSDLVLSVRVRERVNGVEFDIKSVYVP
jgi:hypothetical protein